MSTMEGVHGGFNYDDTRKVLSQFSLDMAVPGGIQDVPARLSHLANVRGADPAITVLHDNYQQLAAGGEDVFSEGAATGLPIEIVIDEAADSGIPAQLLTVTGVNPVDSRFLDGVAYSDQHNGLVYVSIHPNDGGYAYPNSF